MLYRRKEDEMIHINLVGMGRFGKDTIEQFRIDNLECFGASKNGSIRMIVNENDIASICNIVYENNVYDSMDNLIHGMTKRLRQKEKKESAHPDRRGYRCFI